MLVGVGLAVAWIAWSLASEGVIRSGRRVMLPLERTQDPAAFWLFVSIQVILAAGAIIAGCRLVFDGVRRYRMPR